MLILTPGMTVVTDLGRFQAPPLGFSVNGALDQYSARIANILVGNHENAPLLEITASRFSFAAETDLLFAVTGAGGSIRIDGYTAPGHTPVSVETGQIVTIDPCTVGLRSYLAVHGSFTVPLLLGSCAPDSMIGFGLRLEKGQRLACNLSQAPLRNPSMDLPLLRLGEIARRIEQELLIEVTDGPDIGEFGETASRLFEEPYVVSPRSNHVGLRLAGRLPERVSTGEVLSRGVPVGAVEVPSTQELLVLHRGRGVTAGYPVLAVLTLPALDAIAQARPGQRVRFRPTTLEQASLRQLEQHLEIARLRERCWEVLAAHGVRTFGVGLPATPQAHIPCDPPLPTPPQPAESRPQ
ncbi:biotin-dependent carboxyltransferase family protein [Sinomonas terrae]|uniref:Biotin-dependent carboxyltransferase family protein n=1 Tax=Sinomonas terrae TaxID=2908838 RepID=A0ABS9U0L1_9MICC|nr:biotin-dependent carboxyltransferase family protein [Sinomonas terrae]MCH6470168.1 biotin-dependent carboxyltransferase family protein [Sinomonas terrae]